MAEVANGDKVMVLKENHRTYIPIGQVHRLANPGEVPLEIIEVRSGAYLGEDDIVRYEDYYGRRRRDRVVGEICMIGKKRVLQWA